MRHSQVNLKVSMKKLNEIQRFNLLEVIKQRWVCIIFVEYLSPLYLLDFSPKSVMWILYKYYHYEFVIICNYRKISVEMSVFYS